MTVKVMGQGEQEQKKKKKKKKQLTVLETEKVESELLLELVQALDELEKEKKYVDIQVCPKCKSPLVRRVSSMVGDICQLTWDLLLPGLNAVNVDGEKERFSRRPINQPQQKML